jgi:CheY-like chemotaxis protein
MIDSHPETGTKVELLIPATPHVGMNDFVHEDKVASQNGTETILLVDDEEVIRRMSKRMLERYGYQIIVAKNGLDALEIYKNAPDQIDLVILDMIMPKLDGRKTLMQLKQFDSEVKALLFSGNITDDALEVCMAEGFLGFIPKPFETDEMLTTVRQVLDII